MPSLISQIHDLRTEARFRFETGKRERAHELAAQARALFATLPADDPGRAELCAAFADLELLLGNHDACEAYIREAIALATPDTYQLGDHQFFYAKFLLDQGRLDEAEHHAQASITRFSEPGFSEQLIAEIRARRTQDR